MDEKDLEAEADKWLAGAMTPDVDEEDSSGEATEAELMGDDPFGVDDALDGEGSSSDETLAWRETYFVLFQRNERPTLTQVEAAINDASKRLKIENLQADEDGMFRSLLIQAPQDNAALEISFEAGEAVIEQSTELAQALKNQLDGDQLGQLLRADARLDIMHFERVQDSMDFGDGDPDELMMEALDPATLITVVEALAKLTGGLPIDPASGEILI